jgi:chromosome segregation ATPase
MNKAAVKIDTSEEVVETPVERNRRLLQEAEQAHFQVRHKISELNDRISAITREMEAINLKIGTAARNGEPYQELQNKLPKLRKQQKELAEQIKRTEPESHATAQQMQMLSALIGELNRNEAYKRLPQVINSWAEVVRANKHILEELESISKLTLVSMRFGYGLLPDLSNPVIGSVRVEI